jgi:hypothetical protein
LYSCDAEDTIGSENQVLYKREQLEVARKPEKEMGKLPGQLEFAVGMKAMVVMNIATEADLANGSRGEVIDVVLDPCERNPTTNSDGITKLMYPPTLILF